MRIGVVACRVLQRELEQILAEIPGVESVVYLEAALHVHPLKMKEAIREEVNAMKGKVDVVFLGYGYCQSLQGLDQEFDFPVVLPQVDDCIALLLTPERYAEEIKKEVGTWFMTPGWTKIGAEMVIKELKLERAAKYGKDPLEMARRLFTHYRRGLYVDTGVGNEEDLVNAQKFCSDFTLTLETSTTRPTLLREWVDQALRVARGK
ncbi:DUF1638 domain-containing protein [Geomesophilobacter sediminis]|uniref:DUF1638 domain-containing protein n=1 Tax=Geomesophilobacter sediminis TaxID=2798584 RepID=A0A8J7J5C8_9BACT|nr:DUF1638 domain-containing protein [Geomesophilobacter sediminis]MBJ6726238.1 DUF1638 domain-containing protein [Geomesophilobacter sediminis]